MLFNEFEVNQLVKLQREDIERNVRHAWQLDGINQTNFFKKAVQKWKNNHKNKAVQSIDNCACQG